jgi:hypothetical protein
MHDEEYVLASDGGVDADVFVGGAGVDGLCVEVVFFGGDGGRTGVRASLGKRDIGLLVIGVLGQ